MLSAYFDSRGRRFRALHEGPWGALLEGFARTLFESGYPTSTARKHVGAAEHVLHWATQRRWSVADLNEQSLLVFDRHLGRCQCRFRHADRTHVLYGARLFVQCLREAGRIPTPATHDETKDPALLRTFCRWMQEQRGTSAATLSNYARPIRALLIRLGAHPSRLDARGLRRFVLERHRATGWAAAKTCTTALRMFLRFLIAEGQCAVGLDAAIPTIAHWRLAALPRYLAAADVERVIDACDRTSPVGRRDRAILLLLARLGLRAGDVQQLHLGDIDWQRASIHVSGKSRRLTRLPLSQEVGDALLGYLRDGRPSTPTEAVFVGSRAPFRALARGVVPLIVGRALRRHLDAATRRVAVRRRQTAPAPVNRNHANLRQGRCVGAQRDRAAVAGGIVMLIDAVQTYLAVRRSVGFALRWQEDALRSFARFSAARGQHTVSVAVAHEWAGTARQKPQRARRLGVVIRFAQYLHAEDQRHEVPPAIFGAEKSPRPSPYILTTEQIRQVVDAAAQTGSPTLRRATDSTFFALLACTGLRVSEAIRLRVTDITTDGLLIRATKFRKSRLVPLHATARAGLERYLQQRRPSAADDHVFVSLRGKPLLGRDVITAFRSAVSKAGLPARFGSRPTAKSLRHTFATRALHTCPDGRDAVTRHMVALATYLGHKSVAETYWYLEAVPELMRDIADRAEGLATGVRP